MPRRSAAEAAQTKASIVDRAVDLASTNGLEGITIGRLASELRMSKAGVVGHFGSKEALQMAALERALDVFREAVWQPVEHLPAGRERLEGIAERWIAYLQEDVFPGGCFVTAASCEWDGRDGPVRDRLVRAVDLWDRVIAHEAETAGLEDPRQVAFELNAIAMGLNHALQLQKDPAAPERARRAVRRLLAG